MLTPPDLIVIDPCCRTCQHFQTIQHKALYRCLKYAFRRVVDGSCPDREPWENARTTDGQFIQ